MQRETVLCRVQLLYYEAESDLANAMRPTWDEHSYRHVDVIAADRVFADINDAVVNAETRSVSVTQRGVYFAFYDQVSTGSIPERPKTKTAQTKTAYKFLTCPKNGPRL